MSNKPKGVDLTKRSSKEWILFNKRIKELHPKISENTYLYKKIMLLVKEYKECPNCILQSLSNEKIKKRHYVPLDDFEVLKDISDKANMPIATIIDTIIISPILIEH